MAAPCGGAMMAAPQLWLFPELDTLCDPARGPACAVVRRRGRPLGGACRPAAGLCGAVCAEGLRQAAAALFGPSGAGPTGRLGKKGHNCKGSE